MYHRIIVSALLVSRTSVWALQAEWKSLEPVAKIAPRRSGHAFFGTYSNHYVFGGYVEEDTQDGKMKRYVTNDLWNWRENEWRRVQHTPSDNLPRPRLVPACAMSTDSRKAYLFGGWDPGTKGDGGVILDTVHEYDLAASTWRQLTTPLPDGPSSRHVAVTLENGVIVMHNHRCQDFVWLFDPKIESFTKQPTSSACPSSRGLHAACCVDGTTVVVFGGAAQAGTMSNEAFLLDTKTWAWERIAAQGNKPSPRAAPCMVPYSNECVLVYGGAEATATGLNPRGDVWALYFRKGWELLLDDDSSTSVRPPPRNAASLAEIGPQQANRKRFLLSGGWHPFVKTCDDCFVLEVSE